MFDIETIKKIVTDLINEILCKEFTYSQLKNIGFEKLGFDSLMFVRFVVEIEENVGIEFDLLHETIFDSVSSVTEYVYGLVNKL